MLNGYKLSAEVARQAALARQIATLQVQSSTGLRLQNASDDPVGSARVAAIATEQANQTVWTANARTAAGIAAGADDTLAAVQTAVTRAQELMVQARSDTLSDGDRAAIATELRGIVEDLAGHAAATDSSGNPLFGQSATAIPIGRNMAVAAAPSYDDVFGAFDTGSGSRSLVDLVDAAATALEDGEDVTSDAFAALATQLEAAVTHVADQQAAQGVRAARIDAQADRLATLKTSLASARSDIESADVTEMLSQLSAKMLVLEAAQAVLAKVNGSTLFDRI